MGWLEPMEQLNGDVAFRSQRVGIIIAHPDDEAMFFVPSIHGLRGRHELYLLCLSTGNFAGLGRRRRQELLASGEVLGIPTQRIECLDDPKLQDGMEVKWNPAAVSARVQEFVQKHSLNCLVTFDGKGISGHPNHCATYKGVELALSTINSSIRYSGQRNIHSQEPQVKNDIPAVVGYSLVSLPWICKYLGIALAYRR